MLGSCQRCDFVRHVLAVFMPVQQQPQGNTAADALDDDDYHVNDSEGGSSEEAGGSSGAGAGRRVAARRGEGARLLPAAELMPFLAAPSRRLVNLLQVVRSYPYESSQFFTAPRQLNFTL